jgi:diadenylate cyclase
VAAVVAADNADEIERLRATLASIAPGTSLRDGLERILRGRTGALIVLGNDKTVETIATGGFTLDVPFTATGLRELAKMDGRARRPEPGTARQIASPSRPASR